MCKADLQRRFKLALRPGVMLIGMVSRLVSQKGFDLLEQIMEPLLQRDLQFVLPDRNDRERILPLITGDCGLFGSVAKVVESSCCYSDESSAWITDHPRDSSLHLSPCTVEKK